jgi:PAS domain S-box-containing protein
MNHVYKDDTTNEWYYPDNGYILSETDDKGIILYANELFYEIAGYVPQELIGEPHNVVRHPDMPKIAFQGLWDDIQNKGFWTGIVKNLRKDGGYYWVHATAMRKVSLDGKVTYLSVRTKPTRTQIEAVVPVYRELCSQE